MKDWREYGLVAGIYLVIVAAPLVSCSMFMDGMVYAGVARNLAHGIGTPWQLQYTPTYIPEFYGHPPLAIWLLSLAYSVGGDGLWVAKAYSVLMFAATGGLTLLLWKKMGGSWRNGWLPLLLWVLVPAVSQNSPNNLLEVSMAPWVVGSVLLTLHGQRHAKGWKHIACLLAGGAALAGAFLTKGPTGLYPLAMPAIVLATGGYGYVAKGRRWASAAGDTLALMAGLAAPLLTLWACDSRAAGYFSHYVNEQLLATGANTVTVGSRWAIVGMFAESTAIVWGLVAVAAAVDLIKRHRLPKNCVSRQAAALFLLTLCGVLPMMVSMKQRAFYLYTVYPFFCCAAASALLRLTEGWAMTQSKGLKRTTGMAAIALSATAAVLGVTHYGKPMRNVTMQEDLKTLLPHVEAGEVVAIDPSMNLDNYLHCHAWNDGWVALDDHGTERGARHLLLADSSLLHQRQYDTLGYRAMAMGTKQYVLCSKQ